MTELFQMDADNRISGSPFHSRPEFLILLLGFASLAIHSAILIYSFEFELNGKNSERPILTALGLYVAAFLTYLLAGFLTLRHFPSKATPASGEISSTNRERRTTSLICIFCALFHILTAFSNPIQEIDIYRYIVDGAVVSEGLDPYVTPPLSIVRAMEPAGLPNANLENSVDTDHQARLVNLISNRPGLEEALSHVHYKQYTTPYPPVSQAVFGLAMKFVPEDAPVSRYLLTMKFALVIFNLITLGIVVLLLGQLRLPTPWCIAFAWCPILIKEIANSGHLDSIAVCLLTGSVLGSLYAFWPDGEEEPPNSKTSQANYWWLVVSATLLAAAVAAKIFPVILFPLWVIVAIRRCGLKAGLVSGVVLVVVTMFMMWPMAQHFKVTKSFANSIVPGWLDAPDKSELDTGLEVFAKYWEMNDLLFMIVVENLKPDDTLAEGSSNAWFVFTSNDFRTSVVDRFEDSANSGRAYVAFWITKRIFLGVLATITVCLCVRFCWYPTRRNWLASVFLMIAWFFMLAPTQNPWYWTWALPFLIFTRSKVWWLVSGLLFAYYLRFFFEYHYPTTELFGTGLRGTQFFDQFVPWIEFGPVTVLLLIDWIKSRFQHRIYQSKCS